MAGEKSQAMKFLETAAEMTGIAALGRMVKGAYEGPELWAAWRLGLKELASAFDMSKDGSISQSNEYGLPGSVTPGAIDRAQDGKSSPLGDLARAYGFFKEDGEKGVEKEQPKEMEADKEHEL